MSRNVVELFDEDTGLPSVQAEVNEQKAFESEAEQEAAEYAQMAATSGWKRLEKWLADAVDACKEALIEETDADNIKRLQQTARAYSNVIGHIYQSVEANRLNSELKASKSFVGAE